ncbi:MAG: hypothetical protein H6799_01475 [Candidatus Nomurabacteria bacterium]|nr:MAG: hypothetical protein H6799_01475 [Candidatus Nomurabacteria bacterium]HRV75940.1 hypothetical protein [Candidatus Saccharimonadales bacterium]
MSFNNLLLKLKKDFPETTFEAGDHFSWNSDSKKITYTESKNNSELSENKLANKLLHEVAHAELNHFDYQSDAELLKIESSAWHLTKELCKKYKIKFNQSEQEEALSSYINWASSRSECPKCRKNGLQTAVNAYVCPNCSHKWNVGKSRFTRTYRH